MCTKRKNFARAFWSTQNWASHKKYVGINTNYQQIAPIKCLQVCLQTRCLSRNSVDGGTSNANIASAFFSIYLYIYTYILDDFCIIIGSIPTQNNNSKRKP